MSATDDTPRAHATTASDTSQPFYVLSSDLCPLDSVSVPKRGGENDRLLAMHRAGQIQPVSVEFPAAIVPQAARRVRDDFALIYGLQLWAGNDYPVPYGQVWAADRLQLPEVTVWRSLRRLVDVGVLTFCGELPARGKGNGTRTYLPGNAR
jgi:hypothetical protein